MANKKQLPGLLFFFIFLFLNFAGAQNASGTQCSGEWKYCYDEQVLRVCQGGYLADVTCLYGCDISLRECKDYVFDEGCVSGQRRCNPYLLNQADVCRNGVWAPEQTCAYGCYLGQCVQGSPTCYASQRACYDGRSFRVCKSDGQWGDVHVCGAGYECSGGYCYKAGERECAPIDSLKCAGDESRMIQRCNEDFEWEDYRICEIGCKYGQCMDCYPGDRMCVGDIALKECKESGQWGEETICMSNYECSYGMCRPKSPCTVGEIKCVANALYECTSNGWRWQKNCPGGTECVQLEGKNASCEIAGKACYGWSEWEQKAKSIVNETDELGRSRECTNATNARWCIRYDGSIDYSKEEINYSYECGQWAEECGYELERVESYIENQGGDCRKCVKEIYAQKCQPTGRKINGSEKEESECSQWAACEAKTEENTGQQQDAGIEEAAKKYEIALGAAAIVLIAVIAFLAGKMMGNAKES